MNRLSALVGVIGLCSACAILPEQVEVTYTPDPSVARPARVAAQGEVRLHVADARHAESPVWIADKKNGYGMRLASVNAQRPVADLVRDALTQELQARGISVGSGRDLIQADITRFETDYRTRFFSVGAVATADFAIQVRRADGVIAYARNFSVTNDEEAGLAGTAGQSRRATENALSKIVGQIVADPAFLAALVQGGKTS